MKKDLKKTKDLKKAKDFRMIRQPTEDPMDGVYVPVFENPMDGVYEPVPEDPMDGLYAQLALDYCCSMDQVKGKDNVFTTFEKITGRRRFDGDDCFFKMASIKGKILATGSDRLMPEIKKLFENKEGSWAFEAPRMRKVNDILLPHGYEIEQIHPFFFSFELADVADITSTVKRKMTEADRMMNLDVRILERGEIETYRGDKRFNRAFSFLPNVPDVIGVKISDQGKILAMAGASADSPEFYQIGIDVAPEARGFNLGSLAVGYLKNEILRRDKVPYYGTAVSHTLSQNIAIQCGFRLGWTELITREIQNASE